MIVGVGVDLVEIERVRKVYQRWQQKFLKKIFTLNEIAYCQGKKDPIPHLAVRFAAKEALSKALKSLSYLPWQEIEIRKTEKGAPFYFFSGSLFYLNQKNIQLSLTHSQKYAAAFCVIEDS
jgi:holo-[acyl-carrier protein] synthase